MAGRFSVQFESKDLMADNLPSDIGIILVRMEGKLDRFGDLIGHMEKDVSTLRTRQHEMANHLQVVISLNLPEKLAVLSKCDADTLVRVTALETLEAQRKGAMGAVKVIWAIAGAVGIGGVAAVLRIIQVGI